MLSRLRPFLGDLRRLIAYPIFILLDSAILYVVAWCSRVEYRRHMVGARNEGIEKEGSDAPVTHLPTLIMP